MNRNGQIDTARGIAILLVVLGHSFYSIDYPLNKIILTFHMPLFFVLSGLVAKNAAGQSAENKCFMLNKLKSLLIPQLLLGIVSYTYYGLFTVVIKGSSLREVDLLYQFWRYWFLQVLFLVVIIFHFVSQIVDMTYVKNQIRIGTICLIMGLLFEYKLKWPDESPFYINVVPMAFFFYLLGFAGKNFFIGQLNMSLSRGKKLAIMSVSTVILIFCALCNSCVTMYNNNYGIFPLFMLGALSGFTVVWIVADFVQKNSFLKWCGINSIIVYVWQFVLTQFFKNVVEITFEKMQLDCPDIIMTLIVFIICVLVVIPIIAFSNRFIPELYGKKKMNR